jgi:hypothetical protein
MTAKFAIVIMHEQAKILIIKQMYEIIAALFALIYIYP